MPNKTEVTKNREVTLNNVLEYKSNGMRGVIPKGARIRINIKGLSSDQLEILLASQLIVDLGNKIDQLQKIMDDHEVLENLNAQDILTEDIDGNLYLSAEYLKNATSATKAMQETIKSQSDYIKELERKLQLAQLADK